MPTAKILRWRLALSVLLGAVLCQTMSISSSSDLEYDFQIAEPNDQVARTLTDDDARSENHNYNAYAVDVIFDPCRGHTPDCCWDTFGSPEYTREPRRDPVGYVWALAQDGTTFRCQNPCSGDWKALYDTSDVYNYHFDQLDADENNVWALNVLDQTLFKRSLDGSVAWEFISGSMRSISAAPRQALFAIRNDNTLVTCIKPCSGEWEVPVDPEGHVHAGETVEGPSYTDLSGRLREMVEVDGDEYHLWVLLDTGQVFMRRMALDINKYESRSWADVTDTEWSDITTVDPGVVTTIAVSAATQYLYVLTDLHEVYSCVKPCATGAWIPIGDPLNLDVEEIAVIDAGQTQLLAVTASGNVLKREHTDEFNNAWVQIPINHERNEDVDESTVSQTDVLLESGFKSLSVSANPFEQYDFELYTVEREPRICGLASTAEACLELEDDGCLFSEELEACEKLVPTDYSRLQDKEILFNDETCAVLEGITSDGTVERQAGYALVQETEGADLSVVADADCVADGVRRLLSEDKPVCWDHNATISGSQSCVDTDGYIQYNCVNIGFTSTAFIVQCRSDQACGTFLEVHMPGDEQILSQVRIPRTSSRTSGYRTMAISLLYTDGNNFDWLNDDLTISSSSTSSTETDATGTTDTSSTSDTTADSSTASDASSASSDTTTATDEAVWTDTSSSGQAPGTAGSQSFEDFRNLVSEKARNAAIGNRQQVYVEALWEKSKVKTADELGEERRPDDYSVMFGENKRVLCLGDYEVWWVQRTREKAIVEYVKKFAVVSPLCDFDVVQDSYLKYRTGNNTYGDVA